MENDPTTNAEGTNTKIAIDATLDLTLKQDYKRVTYPKVDLSRWI
jgi:hypothetical protein